MPFFGFHSFATNRPRSASYVSPSVHYSASFSYSWVPSSFPTEMIRQTVSVAPPANSQVQQALGLKVSSVPTGCTLLVGFSWYSNGELYGSTLAVGYSSTSFSSCSDYFLIFRLPVSGSCSSRLRLIAGVAHGVPGCSIKKWARYLQALVTHTKIKELIIKILTVCGD